MLQRHLSSLSVETFPVRLEVLLRDLHSSQVVPAFEWVLGIRGLFLTMLLFPSATGIMKLFTLCGGDTSFAMSLRGRIPDVSRFSISSRSATTISLFQILPAIHTYPMEYSSKNCLTKLAEP